MIVTGGSKGIGYKTAQYYSKAGAKLVITARNAVLLDATRRALEKDVLGVEVLSLAVDASEPDAGKRAVQATVERWNRVDIVIANSGVGQASLQSESSLSFH